MPVEEPRLHVIAGIDQPQADAAVDRRYDPGVGEVEVLGVDQRLVRADRAFILLDDEFLVLRGLGRDRILLQQGLVARVVRLGLVEQALVMRELALVLRLERLIGAGVDLGEDIAFLDVLALGKGDALQIAGNLAHHRHGRDRRHRAQRVDDHVDVAGRDGGDADRRLARIVAALAAGRLRRGLLLPACGSVGGVTIMSPSPDGENGDQDQDDPAQPRPRRRGRGAEFARPISRGGLAVTPAPAPSA